MKSFCCFSVLAPLGRNKYGTVLLVVFLLFMWNGTQAVAVPRFPDLTFFQADTATAGDKQTSLDEVVVVGYGVQRKKDLTGASSMISSKDFNKGLINSPDQLLNGKVSGVQVISSSGDPGGESTIKIRGVSSIRSNNNPLYVVDGVPLDGGATQGAMDNGFGGKSDSRTGAGGGLGDNIAARNPLNFLNPSDIASINVLKDASATAIYGSRGANGVILITTKKGKAGAMQVTLDASLGFSVVAKKYNLLSKQQFFEFARKELAATGSTVGANQFDLGMDTNGVRLGNYETNWQDQILQVGFVQNYALSFGGGNKGTRYQVSLSHMNQQGIIKNTGMSRTTARVNASQDLFNQKVKLEVNVTASRTEDEYAPISNDAGQEGSLIGVTILANPSAPIHYVDGLYKRANAQQNDPKLEHKYFQPRNEDRNPVAMLDYIKDVATTGRMLGNFAISVNPLKGLTYKFLMGYDASQSNRKTSYNANLNTDATAPSNLGATNSPVYAGGKALRFDRTNISYNLTNTLTYDLELANHSLNILAGFEYIKYQREGSNARAQFFLDYTIPGADQMYNTFQNADAYLMASFKNQNDLQSVFGRVNYAFKNKYLLTATLRQDGSSRFGANNKYALFPAVSLAWKIDQETFLPNFFDELKIRAGWGITGNQEFPSNVTLATFAYDRSTGGTYQKNNPNPDIKWEQTASLNLGIDFALFGNRWYGNIDYFDRQTTNMLMQVAYAQPAATEYIWQNLDGMVVNRGVEFFVGGIPVQTPKFQWEISLNYTYLRNQVQGLKTIINTGAVSGPGLTGAYAERIVDGQPLNVFYMPTFTGFDANGYNTFANDGESAYQGTSSPTSLYGMTNTLTYKHWSLNFVFSGAAGFYVYNNTATARLTKAALLAGRNVTVEAASSPENPSNAVAVSTRFLEDGTFLRLSNLTLSYTFDFSKYTKYVKSIRVYATGQNLLLITGYSGLDPEVSVNKLYGTNGVPSASMDYEAYPRARTFIFGLSVNF